MPVAELVPEQEEGQGPVRAGEFYRLKPGVANPGLTGEQFDALGAEFREIRSVSPEDYLDETVRRKDDPNSVVSLLPWERDRKKAAMLHWRHQALQFHNMLVSDPDSDTQDAMVIPATTIERLRKGQEAPPEQRRLALVEAETDELEPEPAKRMILLDRHAALKDPELRLLVVADTVRRIKGYLSWVEDCCPELEHLRKAICKALRETGMDD